jgi:predicted ATPase
VKLGVENLARIKKAEVEVKNLTLFVGQNSTHKSYMAHVIYEFYKHTHHFLDTPISQNNYITKELILKIKKIDTMDVNYLFKIITLNNSSEVSNTFGSTAVLTYNYDDNKLKKILLSIYSLVINNFLLAINDSFNSEKNILKKVFLFDNIIDDLMKMETIQLHLFNSENMQDIDYILHRLVVEIYSSITKICNEESVYYFPASRSGYTIALEAIYSGMFSNAARGKKKFSRLTEPTIDFIEKFYDIKNEQNQDINLKLDDKNRLIDFLQTNIIKGKIIEDINEFNYSNYYLEVEDKKIDLHLASSATLETLPFIVFLKNIKDISKTFFVIEEPEAHLHPKAQIQMAKFIVMLSNAGAKVLVTTHSDYILNEINNCIKLDSLEKENEFAISKDDVSAYLFKNEEKETVVNELEIDNFGIANDNFDEVLDELLEKSSELSERVLDAE